MLRLYFSPLLSSIPQSVTLALMSHNSFPGQLSLRLRLEVGIEAQNLESELACTNTVIWMSLELKMGMVSEY
jgi:hypothetical protein